MIMSVLQDWVTVLSLRQQGVLILALRGPDGTVKESGTKNIIRSLRGMVMVNGQLKRNLAPGEYVQGDPFARMDIIDNEAKWNDATKEFFRDFDSYNIHFFQHLAHAYGVAGCGFPMTDFHRREIRHRCWAFYEKCCRKLHMHPEGRDELMFRLRAGEREEVAKEDAPDMQR